MCHNVFNQENPPSKTQDEIELANLRLENQDLRTALIFMVSRLATIMQTKPELVPNQTKSLSDLRSHVWNVHTMAEESISALESLFPTGG